MPTPHDISTFNHLAKHGWVFLRKTLSRVPHWMHSGTGLRAQNKTHAVAMNTSIPKNFTVASEAEIQRLCDNLRGMPVLDASGKNLGLVVRAWFDRDPQNGTVFVKAEMHAKGSKHTATATVACLNLPAPVAAMQKALVPLTPENDHAQPHGDEVPRRINHNQDYHEHGPVEPQSP